MGIMCIIEASPVPGVDASFPCGPPSLCDDEAGEALLLEQPTKDAATRQPTATSEEP
jgi:hypothetical protein